MTEPRAPSTHRRGDVRRAALMLRNAEGDLARLAGLAVLTKLPAEPGANCAEVLERALGNVRAALAIIDRAR